MQHVCAKGVNRLRSYGVQATKTLAKIPGLLREALSQIKEVVRGAVKIIARLTYRQRYPQSRGREPLMCPHCHPERGLWKMWHPKYGGVDDELEAIKRGQYGSRRA